MRPQLVSRLPRVGTTIFTVMSQLATELGAVNLGQGFPDFEPPLRLRELVAQHLGARHNQYSPMAGLPRLREQVAAELGRLYDVTVDPGAEVTVTAGGTEALFCAIQAVVHPGDEVIVFDPAYDSYEPAVELAGGRVVHLPLSAPDFGIDFDRLAAALTARTSLVIVNTPHNPSGRVLARPELDRLAQVLEGSRAFLLTDEVYQHLVYDGRRHVTALEVPALRERTLAAFSFGKTYHATGWKVGYCVAPPPLTAEFRKVHQYVTFAVSTPVQYALADFMEEAPGFVTTLAAMLQERRDRFLALLAGSRFAWAPAASTYFQLADYSALSDATDLAFCEELVRRHGVAAIPLSPFCAAQPEARLVRFCFAKDDATLERGAARLCAIA